MAERIRPEVSRAIGAQIRTLRSARGQTLTHLAEASAVSRRMLTQIELGQANPSLATVDRIAEALDTTLSGLLGLSPEPSPEGVEIWSTENGSWAYLLKSTETPDVSVELWRWHLEPGDRYQFTPTPGGHAPLIHVSAGALRVGGTEESITVSAPEAARIEHHTPYAFTALGGDVDFHLVVVMPRHPHGPST